MSIYMTMLLIITMGILLFSLGYTMSVLRNQKALKGNLDSRISTQVQQHAYIRNPVFLTYAIFFALVILIIVTFALTINW